MLIETKDKSGKPNGWVYPIWQDYFGAPAVLQVYAIAVLPGTRKGPHLHNRRGQYLVCVTGNVRITVRSNRGKYTSRWLLPGNPPLAVAPGVPMEIANPGPGAAVLVNCPDAPYDPQDNEEVVDWNPPDLADEVNR